MRCKDVINRQVVTCVATESAADCARRMREHNVGFLPVVNAAGVPIGTVTDRDLVLRVFALGQPAETQVSSFMSAGPVTLDETEELEVAERMMEDERRLRIILVDPAGRCSGVLSLADVALEEQPSRVGQVYRAITARERKSSLPPRA